nr:terpene synthase 11 [Aquilaria agallochum]
MKCGPRVSTSKLRANMSQFNALVSTTTSAVLPVRTNRSCFRAPALGTTSVVVPNRVWAKAVNHDDHPRQSAGFHPDIWGDLFLASSSTASASENEMLEHEKLKQDVRKMIITASEDPARNLGLVDSIQRLGVSYHFEEEIKELLQKMHDNYDRYRKDNADNLSNISLCFRLLRQEGFRISSDMFSRFKDHEGNFNVSQEDIEGLLALHEATQLRVHGENILDEALVFTLAQLTSILVNNSNSLLSKQIKHYLRYPIRKNIPRLEAKFYISIYKEKPSHSQVLLKFSKLDFNILQKQHNEELTQMSRWWKEELGVERNFPFTRDRIVESYFQVVGFYFEPQYVLGRKFVGKAMAIAWVLDDINDVYGTPEELDLLD